MAIGNKCRDQGREEVFPRFIEDRRIMMAAQKDVSGSLLHLLFYVQRIRKNSADQQAIKERIRNRSYFRQSYLLVPSDTANLVAVD
jgi:hypothetical protein